MPASAPADICLRCPAELTLETVETIHRAWVEESAAPAGLVALDGRAVTTVDTAGLQLLACLVVDLDRDGRSWTWVGASQALRQGAESLGLAELLSFPSSSTPPHQF